MPTHLMAVGWKRPCGAGFRLVEAGTCGEFDEVFQHAATACITNPVEIDERTNPAPAESAGRTRVAVRPGRAEGARVSPVAIDLPCGAPRGDADPALRRFRCLRLQAPAPRIG